MTFSVARRPGIDPAGYGTYLRSPQWRWRRIRWFRDCRNKGFEPCCQVCRVTLKAAGTLDLHHLSYEGVLRRPDGTWASKEKDDELAPMCRNCHQRLHDLLDERRKEFYGWTRRAATVHAVRLLESAGRKR
jgi:hypothetical protein